MQPLAIRLRAARKRFVAESEGEVHLALSKAEHATAEAGSVALLDFQAANGNTLTMTVGGTDTALGFRYAGDIEPRFLSVGDVTATGSFRCLRDVNERIECARWTLIPREDGIAALNEFVVSNEIPESVQWAPFTPV